MTRRSKGRPRSTQGQFTCDRCQQSTTAIRVHWPDGAICGICYHQATRTYGRCDQCQEERMLPGRHQEQQLCRACAGITSDLDCTRCGVEAERYRRGICARCALRDDLSALLSHDGAPREELHPLIEALCASSRPESIFAWKRNPQVISLLTRLGTGELAVSHEGFDQAPAGRPREHLRSILVHHGVLPARDPDLARFESWWSERLKTFSDKGVRQVLEQYATWHHVRAMRERIASGKSAASKVNYAKQQLTEIGRLLTWLQSQDLSLGTCTQACVEQWILEGPTTRAHIRPFLTWAHQNKHATDLKIAPALVKRSPLITHEQRLEWVLICLKDEPTTLQYRVAAVLLLLYAQPIVRIAAMRCDQIQITPAGVSILLGREPAAVPSPFAELLLQLLASRPNLQTANGGASPWLFPSTRSGQHRHPNTVAYEIRALGIDLLGARNAALRDLVHQVPPPIVASQLGYRNEVMLRHAATAGVPDARYAGLVAKHPKAEKD